MKFNLSRYILFLLLLFFILYIIQIHLTYTILTFSSYIYSKYYIVEWNKIYFSYRDRIRQNFPSCHIYSFSLRIYITNLYIQRNCFSYMYIWFISRELYRTFFIYSVVKFEKKKKKINPSNNPIWIKNQKIKRWGTYYRTGGRDILTIK